MRLSDFTLILDPVRNTGAALCELGGELDLLRAAQPGAPAELLDLLRFVLLQHKAAGEGSRDLLKALWTGLMPSRPSSLTLFISAAKQCHDSNPSRF